MTETTLFDAVKKLLKWIAAAVIALVLLASLIGLGVFIFYEIKDRPQVTSELKGVTLGEKLNDVMFKNPGFEKDKKQEPDFFNEIKPHEIKFTNKETKTFVYFKDNLVTKVAYSCSGSLEFTEVSKISCRDTSETLQKRFGKKLRVHCYRILEDKLRAYDVPKFGIRYLLWENQVFGFVISNPLEMILSDSVNWIACD
jgi:hypothetical protein